MVVKRKRGSNEFKNLIEQYQKRLEEQWENTKSNWKHDSRNLKSVWTIIRVNSSD